MDKIQQDLLSLLSHSLFGEEIEDIEISEELAEEAKQQTVTSLITEDYVMLANNIRVDDGHAKLTEVLRGIPFVTMKGYASAYYYPDPLKRSMGDVDFYVHPKDYDKTAKRLLEQGFKPTSMEHERHDAFSKGKVHFELHSEIKGIPNGKDGIKVASEKAEEIVRHYLSDVIETAVTVETQHGEVIIPDEFHHGLIMLLHVAGHIINDGGVGLRHLCDWAVYVDKVDISRFKAEFTDMGLWTFACQLTAVSTKYLGLREMIWAKGIDNRFLEVFIEDIISAGNFGRKEAGRKGSLNLRKENSYIRSLACMCQDRYFFCKKYPILIPVGIVLYTTHYLKLRLTRKAKWVSVKTIKDSKNRKKLYDRFELFENN